MSNGIAHRQNEEKGMKMLAAQRQIYSIAKRNHVWRTLLLTIIPFAFSFSKILFEKSTVWVGVSGIFVAVCIIIGNYLESYVEKEKNQAAFIQQQFDIYVYQMPWDEKLFEENKDVNNIIAKASKKIEKNHIKFNKLKNWYDEKVDLLPINEGIYECQKMNIGWHLGLKMKYRIAVCSAFIIFIIIIVGTGILLKETLWAFLTRITIFVPLFIWMYSTVSRLNKDIKRLDSLQDQLSHLSGYEMENLQLMQKGIYENRRFSSIIPDWFYHLFWSKEEEDAERTLAMKINH